MMSGYVKQIRVKRMKMLIVLFFKSFRIGCYAQKFGARGYGHIGVSSLGLMSDINDKEWQRLDSIEIHSDEQFVFSKIL